MTVNDLFEHFQCIVEEIVYFDRTHNVEDVVYATRQPNGYISEENQRKFLDEYGEYDVLNWEYSGWENKIYIDMEEDVYGKEED